MPENKAELECYVDAWSPEILNAKRPEWYQEEASVPVKEVIRVGDNKVAPVNEVSGVIVGDLKDEENEKFGLIKDQ